MPHDAPSTALPTLVGQYFFVGFFFQSELGASPAPCVAGDRVLSRVARRNPLMRFPPIRVTPPWRESELQKPENRLHRSVLPQSLEPSAGDARVVHGVFGIAMPKVILHRAQIDAGIREVVAARVPQHVWVHVF